MRRGGVDAMGRTISGTSRRAGRPISRTIWGRRSAANHAAILQATGGNMNGQMFLLINDGSVGYSTGDLIVRLTNTTGTLTSANFKT